MTAKNWELLQSDEEDGGLTIFRDVDIVCEHIESLETGKLLVAAPDLLEQVGVLTGLLRELRDNGLIYWEPQTTRGATNRSLMMARIDAAIASTEKAALQPTHRHVKSGRLERVIGEAEAQVSTGRQCMEVGPNGSKHWHIRDIKDGDRLVVYQGGNGKLWVRFRDEFNDGRFVEISTEVKS